MADPTAFQPYADPLYQQPTPWANANTYAPWATPNGQSGSNPSFAGYGQVGNNNSGQNPLMGGIGMIGDRNLQNLDPTGLGLFQNDQGRPGPFSVSSLGWWDFKGGKKRSSPDFYAPSYQGQLFTPQEGMPQWYGTSAQGNASDIALQSMMGGLNSAQPQQPQGQNQGTSSQTQGSNMLSTNAQSYDMGMMPSYIGQAPYLGQTVNNYSPQISGSYGGYDSYGGYGNSQNKPTSNYQPYVPTGYSQAGQY